jgi:hypothetical protein
MINIPNVTLLAIDNTHRIENTIKAIYTSINEIKFGKIKLITTKENIDKYYSDNSEIEFEEMVYNITDINTYSKYMIYELHNHVDTEFAINIQDHGFIINPSMWTNEFLEYDYIGAPWSWSKNSYVTPFNEHIRVGNGGVSLRSKKLLEVPLKVDIPFDCTTGDFYKHFNANNFAEDGNICVHNRHLFIEQGCKFAPVELAAKFSYENSVPENQGIIPFAFHFRLPSGIEIHD